MMVDQVANRASGAGLRVAEGDLSGAELSWSSSFCRAIAAGFGFYFYPLFGD
jgi:hypothetical protein